MSLEYDVVDVFGAGPFSGNQLAVVHGAGELGTDQMLALTREFNYSETTFPTPIGDDRYAVRIFTMSGELPFAGHPTLGTAWVLRDRGLIAGDAVQECAAGEIGVRFAADTVTLTTGPRELGAVRREHAVALAEDCGLAADDLDGHAYVAGAGITFVYLPVRAEALARVRAGTTPVGDHGIDSDSPLVGVSVYAGGPDVRARVLVPGLSAAEDPATGSAAAGLGIVLRERGLLGADGAYEISQGVEMGRPSRLTARIEGDVIEVGGEVHPVARGVIEVPRPIS